MCERLDDLRADPPREIAKTENVVHARTTSVTAQWIFQSNPSRFDIDGALRTLNTIAWRVPQHTASVTAGDIVLIWRSGTEAGIVGLGRVIADPRALAPRADELRFVLGKDEPTEVTRALLHVKAAPFVPKDQVAAVPEMAAHQILTAPMGTVFPLTDEQWAALRPCVPEPPPFGPDEATRTLPAAFSWTERAKAVYPLPGGYDGYLTSLRRIIAYVNEASPTRAELAGWLLKQYGSAFTAPVIDFLRRLSLLDIRADRCQATDPAQTWIASDDPAFLIALLHSRARFIGEMLDNLREPRRTSDILDLANERFSMGWSSNAQVDRRRGWLQSAGMLTVLEDGRLQATESGVSLLSALELYRAQDEPSIAPAPQPQPPTPARAGGDRRVVERLHATMRDTSAPAEFEKTVADAFRLLGLDSLWVGGSGDTDVVLTADLGPHESYRVIVDCKTTSHDAVQDQQIDWTTLREHRDRREADFVAVVGCTFAGSRVFARSRENRVLLIDVDSLATLCTQHQANPVGLEIYRRFFAAPDVQIGTAAVAEAMEDMQRWASLAAAVVQQVTRLEATEGPVEKTDLYWNIRSEGDQFEWVTRDDIQSVLDALAAPAIGVLRVVDGGYKGLGGNRTAAQRLRLLAQRIDPADGVNDELPAAP
jgi:hypothetical protein